jgi:purine-binding chemotaxis protein CheW
MIKKFCSFYLGERFYGVDILDVREISLQMDINSVPHAPEEVKGLVNIRGEIHLVIDLRVLFHLPPLELDGDSRLIIFKSTIAPPFGVLVDRVSDVVEVDEKLIEERRKQDQKGDIRRKPTHSITCGVCKLEKELMIVLDAPQLAVYRQEAS